MANRLLTPAEAAKTFKEAIEAGLAQCETDEQKREFLRDFQNWWLNIPMRDTSSASEVQS